MDTSSMKDVYWELVTKDGETRIEIPPASVDIVKKRWNAGEPIHTKNYGSIAANTIKYFRPTTKVYGQLPLLEAASQAFGEPIYNDDGSIISRWVTSEVTNMEYAKLYSHVPAYRKLRSDGGLVTVAFLKPVHAIDVNKTPYCTEEEEKMLWAKKGK